MRVVSDRVRLELLRFVRVGGEMAGGDAASMLINIGIHILEANGAERKDGAARHVRNLRSTT